MQNSLILTSDHAVTMSSREIAELTGKQLSHIHRDIRNMLEDVPSDDPEKDHVRYDTDDRGYMTCVHLPRELSLTLVSGYSVPIRRAIVKRWQELEAKHAPAVALPDFTNPAESARAWALQYEEREKAQAALALAAPKVQFFDKVVERSTLMTATQVGQKLGMSAVALNKHLDELDVYSKNIKRARVFKQWFVDKGYGELKQTELGHSQPLFTTAGEAWVIERLVSEGYSVSLDNV